MADTPYNGFTAVTTLDPADVALLQRGSGGINVALAALAYKGSDGLFHASSGASAVSTILRIEVPSPATGDAVLDYLLSGVQGWRVGVDASDGAYKIDTNNGTLGSSTVVTIKPSGLSVIGVVDAAAGLRGSGSTGFTSGAGVEISYLSGTGYVLAFSRTASGYVPLVVGGSTTTIQAAGLDRGFFGANGLVVTGSMKPSSFTVGTVPSASSHGAGATIYVSNEAGGAVLAFSDGTNWKRVTDRATIS